MSKIVLGIFAHGTEIYKYNCISKYNKFIFHIPSKHINILNCGTGVCGLPSICNQNYIDLLTDNIEKYISGDNYFTTISNIMKPIYAKCIDNVTFTSIGKFIYLKDLNRIKSTIDNGDHCKLYYPINNKEYRIEKDIGGSFITNLIFKTPLNPVKYETVNKHIYGIKVFNTFDYNGTNIINTDIFDMTEEINNNKYKQIAENYKKYNTIKLSEIIFVCHLLDFKYVDIFELSCRGLDRTLDQQDELLKLLNEKEAVVC